jgi:diguanylate cyclase (GGDEF)-like protein
MRLHGELFSPLRALALLALVIVFGGLAALSHHLPETMKSSALEAARKANLDTIDQVKRVRGLYTQAVISRALATKALTPSWDWRERSDGIPLPATLVKEISDAMKSEDATLSLVSPYPWPHRRGRELDAFEREAWEIFQTDPDRVISRQETVAGRRVLRLAVADRMTAQACVDCHNADPLSAKRDWRVGDVRGVFEATRVIEPYLQTAERRSRDLLGALAAAASLVTVIVIVLLLFFERRDQEKRAADRAAYHLAEHDALTGLKNRRRLHQEIETRLRRPPVTGLGGALLLVDLDDFKSVNDTFGHGAGDALLQAVAGRLRALVDPGDMLSRLGGDEFALLLNEATSERVERLGRKICARLSDPYEIEGRTVLVGACVGSALVGVDAATTAELLVAADLALYAAKADGRSRWRAFEPGLMAGALKRAQLGLALREALEADALQLHYQPIVEATGVAVRGYEALARWPRPDGSFTPPAEFIPVAEENGLIAPLGAWVLRRACQEIAAFDDVSFVSVNLSSRQLEDEALLDEIKDALRASGLDAARLQIEITESAMVREDGRTLSLLHAIRDLGVGIAIDDFGTGYSCLSYLRAYPVSTVKIDRSFVSTLGSGPDAAALVSAIAALARALGLRTVAEGVETQEQAEALMALGCDALQGYRFGRPGPLARAEPSRLACA